MKIPAQLITTKIFLLFVLAFFTLQAVARTTSPSRTVADGVITTQVKAQIVADPSLSNFAVNVTTHKGVVKLQGTVNTNDDAAALVQMAQSVQGVKDVNTSELKTKESKQLAKDMLITAKIKGLFLREKLFGDQDVSSLGVKVETNNGIVSLTGTVENQTQADNAKQIAQSVAGVQKVISRIEVSGA